MDILRFRPGPHGHEYATTRDGVEIVRCFSGNRTCAYYKKSRPDIDDQRVRMRWEELRRYNLHEPYPMPGANVSYYKGCDPDEVPVFVRPYSLDQKDNMHWGNKICKRMGEDKDGFPLYTQQWEEVLGPGFEDGPTKGLKAFILPGELPNN